MTQTAQKSQQSTAADRSIGERARGAAGATMEAARSHPYAAAGIAAGVVAAVGGAAYAATRLGSDTAAR